MRPADFTYDLPGELIAQQPLAERVASRLLVLDGPTGRLSDRRFAELPSLIAPGDLLVLNDTRVVPARLHGIKDSGGRVEMLLERLESPETALVQLRASKPPPPAVEIGFEGGARARVAGRDGDFFRLVFDRPLMPHLEAHGHVPLPPYIRRRDTALDRSRYQTVYGERPGAVAAPTAGLHFDEAMLERLAGAGVGVARVTLHVGAGTFQPVRAAEVSRHRMHAEAAVVPEATVESVAATRARGGRVVAVGTTVVRSLETAAAAGTLRPWAGHTELFIYPEYRFRVVDAMVTNFHLPESTLLMMVCAFAGTEAVLAAYRHAVARRYRFFSYGDAMFVTRADPEAGS